MKTPEREEKLQSLLADTFEAQERLPNARQVGGAHYGGAQYQHWDWVVENNLGYLEAQITKYVARHRAKNGRQDLEKALHYADKLISVGDRRLEQRFPRAVVDLDKMVMLYRLEKWETEIFTLVCDYRSFDDLELIQALLRKALR